MGPEMNLKLSKSAGSKELIEKDKTTAKRVDEFLLSFLSPAELEAFAQDPNNWDLLVRGDAHTLEESDSRQLLAQQIKERISGPRSFTFSSMRTISEQPANGSVMKLNLGWSPELRLHEGPLQVSTTQSSGGTATITAIFQQQDIRIISANSKDRSATRIILARV